MSEQIQANGSTEVPSGRKRKNLILGLILAASALTMYVSIFLRLTGNPLQ